MLPAYGILSQSLVPIIALAFLIPQIKVVTVYIETLTQVSTLIELRPLFSKFFNIL